MPKGNNYILGLDLGTTTGWSTRFDESEDHISGEWDLKGGRFEGGGMRFLRFRAKLQEIFDELGHPRFVAYEEVRRHLGNAAAHIYGGFQAALTSLCEELEIPYTSYPVGTIKKFATGKGNASKSGMVKAANKRWDKKYTVKKNENEADARWVSELANSKLPK